ncbi:hypothetical protein D3C74_324470 [compost metagenome]
MYLIWMSSCAALNAFAASSYPAAQVQTSTSLTLPSPSADPLPDVESDEQAVRPPTVRVRIDATPAALMIDDFMTLLLTTLC